MADSVELLGVEIPVRTGKDAELVENSLRLVEEQVASIEQDSPGASRIQVALLAALNLAGRLTELEAGQNPPGIEDETLERLDALHERIKRSEVS